MSKRTGPQQDTVQVCPTEVFLLSGELFFGHGVCWSKIHPHTAAGNTCRTIQGTPLLEHAHVHSQLLFRLWLTNDTVPPPVRLCSGHSHQCHMILLKSGNLPLL
mmetsp:Transcript_2605/g.9938  ORF Transcript_2605/g.9938 Transcript_2605/m.9938 type:complete len:104 (-) Transcript_2605:2188-2499(-)